MSFQPCLLAFLSQNSSSTTAWTNYPPFTRSSDPTASNARLESMESAFSLLGHRAPGADLQTVGQQPGISNPQVAVPKLDNQENTWPTL